MRKEVEAAEEEDEGERGEEEEAGEEERPPKTNRAWKKKKRTAEEEEEEEEDEEPPPPARKKQKHVKKKIWDVEKVPNSVSAEEDPRYQVKEEQGQGEEEGVRGSEDHEEEDGRAKGKSPAGDKTIPDCHSNDFECHELLCCQRTRFSRCDFGENCKAW